MNTPILFLIFNRPGTTALIFEKIKQQQPAKLYIAADAPREGKEGEKEKCEAAKKIVLEGMDWDCEVKTLFRTEHLGCGKAVSEAISWFFEQEEEGIILEDDCLPGDSFFMFCADLLEKYRHDKKVMHITGTNLNDAEKFGDSSYYFSRYPHIWGWATWKRAWAGYDFELKDKAFYTGLIDNQFKDPFERRFWKTVLETIANTDTWDYQWMFNIFKFNGVCATTNYNFVLNIGFDADATHTAYQSPNPDLPVRNITHILHPGQIKIDKKGELAFFKTVHNLKKRGYWNYFLMKGGNLLHKIKLLANNKQ